MARTRFGPGKISVLDLAGADSIFARSGGSLMVCATSRRAAPIRFIDASRAEVSSPLGMALSRMAPLSIVTTEAVSII
jgi:hypothetical protein